MSSTVENGSTTPQESGEIDIECLYRNLAELGIIPPAEEVEAAGISPEAHGEMIVAAYYGRQDHMGG